VVSAICREAAIVAAVRKETSSRRGPRQTARTRAFFAESAELETYEQDEHELDYDEFDRRMEAVRRGTAAVIPWDEARRQILSEK
jgi:hypothetical protein